jgi:hypothetical protein
METKESYASLQDHLTAIYTTKAQCAQNPTDTYKSNKAYQVYVDSENERRWAEEDARHSFLDEYELDFVDFVDYDNYLIDFGELRSDYDDNGCFCSLN